MFRCTTDRYEELYAKWLGNPGLLLDLGGYEPHQRLLDLCGGAGVVSMEALRRGAMINDVKLYDLNPRCPDPRVFSVTGDVDKDAKNHRYLDGPLFDLIVIRQAVNYLWWTEDLVAWIQYHLVPGGRLVFNSFVHPLEGGVKPYSYKRYVHGGDRFFEAHLYIPMLGEKASRFPPDFGPMRGRVLHLQSKISGRWGFDVTRFRHLDPDALYRLLSSRFSVEMYTEGRSIRWLCFKRRPTEVIR